MSNNLDITIHDFNNICRTCLSRKDLKPLYGKYLEDMLMACTFVKFREDDGLPAKICTNCITEIGQAISFANRCEVTDTILRKCVKKFETELANNSSQSQKVEQISKAKEEIILLNVHRIVKEVLKDPEYMEEVKQKEDLIIEIDSDESANESYEENVDEAQDETNSEKSDDRVSNSRRRSTVKEVLKQEVKQEEELIIKNESDEDYDEPANESYEEDADEVQDETNSEKSDYPGFNSQIKEDSAKDEDDYSHFSKIIPKLPCFEKFSDVKVLKKHREVKHPPNRFSQKSSLGPHKNTQHSEPNDRKYQCQTCDKFFRRLALLNTHQKMHTREDKDDSNEEDVGEDQDRTYIEKSGNTRSKRRSINSQIQEDSSPLDKRRNLLKIHQMRKKDGERPFACHVCGKAFKQLRNLKGHKRLHTGEKPYVCSVCSKTFTHNNSLTYHMRAHTGEKPYSCEVCSKAFTQSNDLKIHMRGHTGQKPYSCEVCSRAFTQLCTYKTHMRIHTGEKPYSCEVCSKAFARHSTFKAHMRVHTGEKPYSCEVCSKAFAHYSTLKAHMRLHTGEKPYICEVCNKAFAQAGTFNYHMKYVCNS